VTRIAVFAASSLFQLPPSLQDMGLQVLLLTICGAVVRYHLRLYEIYPLLVVVPSLLIVTVIYVLFVSGRKVRNYISPTYPLLEQEEEEKEEPEELTEEKIAEEGKVVDVVIKTRIVDEDEEKQRSDEDGEVFCSADGGAVSRRCQSSEDLEGSSLHSALDDDSTSGSGSGGNLLDPKDWAACGSSSSSPSGGEDWRLFLRHEEEDSSSSGSQPSSSSSLSPESASEDEEGLESASEDEEGLESASEDEDRRITIQVSWSDERHGK
jgi:hypothetical protein